MNDEQAKLAEVRRRMITDHHTDTSGSDASRWWSCRVCAWSWRHGQPELHEPSCPLRPVVKVLKEAP